MMKCPGLSKLSIFAIFICMSTFVAKGHAAESLNPVVGSVTCLFIPKAEIDLLDTDGVGKFGYSLLGHVVKSGESSVIALRWISGKDEGPDSQLFNKLTLELHPTFNSQEKLQKKNSVPLSFFSSGSSAFLKKGAYEIMVNPIRQVETIERDGKIFVSIKQTVSLTGFNSRSISVKRFVIKCRLQEKNVSELSQWEGAKPVDFGAFFPPIKPRP
jgi:hypothetical protein